MRAAGQIAESGSRACHRLRDKAVHRRSRREPCPWLVIRCIQALQELEVTLSFLGSQKCLQWEVNKLLAFPISCDGRFMFHGNSGDNQACIFLLGGASR